MKTSKNSIISVALAGIGFALLCTHFVAIAIYLAPANPISQQLERPINKYINPIFTQNWKLFAPTPSTTNRKTWVRCEVGNAWSQWQDPLESLQRKHNGNRISYRGKLLYVYRGVGNQLINMMFNLATEAKCDLNQADCMRGIVPQLEKTSAYAVAKRYSEAICAKNTIIPKMVAKTQFRFVTVYPKQFSERKSDKPFGRITYFDSPEVQL
jgi:hypothetical protein